jgi:predicted nucleic acid-binding protein
MLPDVTLDVILEREPFVENAKKIWTLHENQVITAYISPITPINVFYIVRKQKDITVARTAVHLLLQSLNLCIISGSTLVRAYESAFSDFEDATQHAVAIEAGLEAIITRNPSDYKGAILPIYSPPEFVAKYNT